MERLLRIQEVVYVTGFTRGWIYVLMRKGEFPLQVPVGKRAVRWRSTDVQAWISALPQATYRQSDESLRK